MADPTPQEVLEVFTRATEGVNPKKPLQIEAGQLRMLCQLARQAAKGETPKSEPPKADGKHPAG